MPMRATAITIVFGFLSAGVAVYADAQAPVPSAEKAKKEALEFLDSYGRFQVLFHPEDVKKLRDRVAAMSPEEAAAWWAKTTPQRQLLTSPEWAETEAWLRKFLQVQAKYSDAEISARQTELEDKAKDSAASLKEALDRITQARRRLTFGNQAAAETRQMQIAANEAYRQDEVRRREAARQQANAPPAAAFPAPVGGPTKPQWSNAPLIDSMDVARWAVLRTVFPTW